VSISEPTDFGKKEYLLVPFYGDTRRFDMVFDWTSEALSFGVLHLSMSILADNINSYTQNFIEEFSDLIYNFAYEVILSFDYEQWVITEEEIDAWLESRNKFGW